MSIYFGNWDSGVKYFQMVNRSVSCWEIWIRQSLEKISVGLSSQFDGGRVGRKQNRKSKPKKLCGLERGLT